jgi:hypothetical protein
MVWTGASAVFEDAASLFARQLSTALLASAAALVLDELATLEAPQPAPDRGTTSVYVL